MPYILSSHGHRESRQSGLSAEFSENIRIHVSSFSDSSSSPALMNVTVVHFTSKIAHRKCCWKSSACMVRKREKALRFRAPHYGCVCVYDSSVKATVDSPAFSVPRSGKWDGITWKACSMWTGVYSAYSSKIHLLLESSLARHPSN